MLICLSRESSDNKHKKVTSYLSLLRKNDCAFVMKML